MYHVHLSVAVILQEIVILLKCLSQTDQNVKKLLHGLIKEVEFVSSVFFQGLQWHNILVLDQVFSTFALQHFVQVRQLDHFDQGRGMIVEVQNLPLGTS